MRNDSSYCSTLRTYVCVCKLTVAASQNKRNYKQIQCHQIQSIGTTSILMCITERDRDAVLSATLDCLCVCNAETAVSHRTECCMSLRESLNDKNEDGESILVVATEFYLEMSNSKATPKNPKRVKISNQPSLTVFFNANSIDKENENSEYII